MVGRKQIRTRGKLQFSKYFQTFKKGDFVAIDIEKSVPSNLLKRLQGRTGVIDSRKGRCYMINMKDQNKEKKYLVQPIHLKKIKQTK